MEILEVLQIQKGDISTYKRQTESSVRGDISFVCLPENATETKKPKKFPKIYQSNLS